MPDFLVFTALIPKIFGARVVLYIFDNVPEYFAFKHGIDEKHPVTRAWRFIERISTSFSDHVIVTQSAAKETLQRNGVPGSKITVVLNTPKEGIFCPIKVRDSTDNNERFVLMTHGVILHSYGNQTIIQAIPILADRIPELEVRIVGSGEYLDELKRLTQNLHVEEYVFFPGRVSHSEIPGMISEADIGVVPKLVDLMLPVKLMEYVAMGKPVVASAQPTMKAYFDDNSMMFFEPGNEKDLARCVLEIYSNPSKGRSMVYYATKQFEKYRWDVVKYDYLGIYEKLLSG
jgi:glycosyltransferase involved in cell wall biosynthesis